MNEIKETPFFMYAIYTYHRDVYRFICVVYTFLFQYAKKPRKWWSARRLIRFLIAS